MSGADLTGGYTQISQTINRVDEVRDLRAAAAIAGSAHDADDARTLLAMLGLSHAAPAARAVLRCRNLPSLFPSLFGGTDKEGTR